MGERKREVQEKSRRCLNRHSWESSRTFHTVTEKQNQKGREIGSAKFTMVPRHPPKNKNILGSEQPQHADTLSSLKQRFGATDPGL